MDHNISYTTSLYRHVATRRINGPEKTLMLKSYLLYSNPGRSFCDESHVPVTLTNFALVTFRLNKMHQALVSIYIF